jgi:hypothetical protein
MPYDHRILDLLTLLSSNLHKSSWIDTSQGYSLALTYGFKITLTKMNVK